MEITVIIGHLSKPQSRGRVCRWVSVVSRSGHRYLLVVIVWKRKGLLSLAEFLPGKLVARSGRIQIIWLRVYFLHGLLDVFNRLRSLYGNAFRWPTFPGSNWAEWENACWLNLGTRRAILYVGCRSSNHVRIMISGHGASTSTPLGIETLPRKLSWIGGLRCPRYFWVRIDSIWLVWHLFR